MKINKLSTLLCLSAGITLLPLGKAIDSESFAVRADEVVSDTINLGSFDLLSGKFEDATATETNTYNCATISLASSINGNETIILPTVDGYTIETDVTTTYSKVISMSSPKTAKQILEEYVSEIVFFNCNKQKLSIVLSNEIPTNRVGYFSDNQHYYMFIEDVGQNWDEAYEIARGTTFLGRQGYLATITSVEEDSFIYKITDGCVGWLGGTTMKHSATPNGQYYDYFDTEQPKDWSKDGPDTGEHYVGYWYWACGPEIGEQFFDVISVPNNATEQTEIYQRNADTNNYYFNWNTHPSGAYPWNPKLDEYEPNANYPIENCLTTLNSGGGYRTNNDISYYSWNNINSDLHGADRFGAKGYVVEFGDLKNGDSNSDLSNSFVSSVFSFHSHSNDNFTEWTSKTSLPTEPGSYFLSDDVTLTETWNVPEGNVKLCLGGHLITGDGTFTLINVNEDSNLILTSCDDDIKHNGYTDEKLVWHSDPLNKHVLGDGETDYPLYGAVIAGGKTGINVNGSLYADSIRFSGNVGENGGALYISETGVCTLQTLRIEFNEAENGAGIYNDGTLAIFDTYISENYVGSEGHGGAIYHNGINPLTLGGVDSFTSNGYDQTDDLYFLDGKKIMLDEELHPIVEGETFVLFNHEKGEGIICDYLTDIDTFSDCINPIDKYLTGMSFVTFEKQGDGYSAILMKAKLINNEKPFDESTTNNGYLEDDFMGVAFPGYPVTITVTAEPGYMLKADSLVVNNGDVEVKLLSETNSSIEWTASYWFIMPNEDVTMDCDFVAYTIRQDNSITNAVINNGESIEFGSTFDITFDATYGKDTYKYYFYNASTYEYYDEMPTSVGTYSLIIAIPGTEEYAGVSLKIDNIEIVKCQNEISELILEDWEYGATPNTPQIVAKAGTAVYTYSTSESGPFTSDVPTEVGTYYVKATIVETDNYTGAEKVASFQIKESTVPTPVPEDDTNNSCSLHWILVGAIVLAAIITVLYIILKFKDAIAYIILAILDVTSVVTGVFGLAANKCLFCGIMLGVNVVIISLMIVFVYLFNKKIKEDKEEKKAK